jgi:hypothetical protein
VGPRKIGLSLKRYAQRSKRRKGTPYQSAMSMSNFTATGEIFRKGGSEYLNMPRVKCAMCSAENRNDKSNTIRPYRIQSCAHELSLKGAD